MMKKLFLFLALSLGVVNLAGAQEAEIDYGNRFTRMVENADVSVTPDGQFDISQYQKEFGAIGTNTSLRGYIVKVLNFLLSFLGLLAFIALVYAGFLYVTAGGEDGQHGKAKSIIIFVVIGIFVILAAYALVFTLITRAGTGTADRAPISGSGGGSGGSGFHINLDPNKMGQSGGGETSGTQGAPVASPGGEVITNSYDPLSLIVSKKKDLRVPTPSNAIVGTVQWKVAFPKGGLKTAKSVTGNIFPFSSKEVGAHTVQAQYKGVDNNTYVLLWTIMVAAGETSAQ